MNKKSTYEKEIPTRSLLTTERWFNNENKFKSEKEFIDNLLPKLPTLIKEIYNEDVEMIEDEKTYDFLSYGYFKIRADLVVRCKSGVQFVIECKNPTNNKSEILSAFGQMIGYQLLLGNHPKMKLILALPIFYFYMAIIMKNHNINCDLLMNNKKGCAFLLKSELG